MARFITMFTLIGVIVAAALASAAALGPITEQDIAAGDAVVGSCDTTGATIDYVTQVQDHPAPTHFEVAGVTVSNLDAACDGDYVLVDLQSNGSHFAFGSSGLDCNTGAASAVSSGPISGGSATAELCNYVPAEDVEGISVLVKSTP